MVRCVSSARRICEVLGLRDHFRVSHHLLLQFHCNLPSWQGTLELLSSCKMLQLHTVTLLSKLGYIYVLTLSNCSYTEHRISAAQLGGSQSWHA